MISSTRPRHTDEETKEHRYMQALDRAGELENASLRAAGTTARHATARTAYRHGQPE